MRTRETCPLCGTTAEDAVHFITTSKGYDLWRCLECGLVHGRDILDEDEIFVVYDDDYVRHYGDPALAEQMYRLALDIFAEQEPGRVLEVGCGNGHTLRALADLGYTVRGCEVNAAAARHCEEQGFDVKALPFEKYRVPPPNARFDYVVSIHVVEHVAEPAAFAEKVGKALKPGGLWFNYMPNVAVTEAHNFDEAHGPDWIHFRPTGEPQHINFFDPATSRRLIETAGLEYVGGGERDDDLWTWARRPE